MVEPSPPDPTYVELTDATPPFAIAVDIGSGSTRGSLYDADARPVRGKTHEVNHAFRESAAGTAEINADQIVNGVAQTLSVITKGLSRGFVAAIAMDTFASSLVCVDKDGDALTPCFTYADSRSAPYVEQLRVELEEMSVHQRTGTRLHTSYTPGRLLWVRAEMPEVWSKTVRFLSLGEYVYEKLAQVKGAAISTVAWSGMLNRHTLDIDQDLLDVTKTRRDQFAQTVPPSAPQSDVSRQVEIQWPALAGAAWFPAIPDGLASNLGVGADTPSTAAMSAATSGAVRSIVPGTPAVLPSGLWCYSISRDTSIVGGALNDVGRLIFWLERTLAPISDEVLSEALSAPPAPGTPLVFPFLTGERATGWVSDARAAFLGVSSATTPVNLFRGALEGIAMSYARIFDRLREVNPDLRRVIASGGGAHHYPGAMKITAQALDFPIQVVDARRVTMRGAAIFALSVIQPEHQVPKPPLADPIIPDPAQHDYYAELQERFSATYRALFS